MTINKKTKAGQDKKIERNFYPFNHPGLIEQNDNKAVIIVNYDTPEDFPLEHSVHLCGYVYLEKDQMPKDLQVLLPDSYLDFINVPGGVTYCRPEGAEPELAKIARDNCNRKLDEARYEIKNPSKYVNLAVKARIQYHKDLIDIGSTGIVYGFDLNHAEDYKISQFQDSKFVLKICDQLEQQLLELAKWYPELIKAKAKERKAIVDLIRDTASIDFAIATISLFLTNLFRDDDMDKE